LLAPEVTFGMASSDFKLVTRVIAIITRATEQPSPARRAVRLFVGWKPTNNFSSPLMGED